MAQSSIITDSIKCIKNQLSTCGYTKFTEWCFVFPSESQSDKILMFCHRYGDDNKAKNVTLKIFQSFLSNDAVNERKIYTYLTDIARIQPVSIKNLQGHVNVLKYFDYFCLNPQQSPIIHVLVIETCRENFSSVIKRRNSITESQKIKWIKQIIFGLEYLHSLMIVHHDLKPSNIFVSFNNECKISDFDKSKILSKSKEKDDIVYEYTMANTLSFTYFPPDYLTSYIITLNFDVWSLAAIVYCLFTSDSAVNLKKIVPISDLKCVVFLELHRLEEFLYHQNALKRLLLKSLTFHCEERYSLAEFKKIFFKIKK
jgi:serine/threonine protein kinase